MKTYCTLAAATLLASGLFLSATFQDKPQDKAQDKKAPAAGDMGAPGMPKPGKEHELLKKGAGMWDAVIKMNGQEFKGGERAKMQAGGMWLVYDFHCDNFMGMTFEGHGASGYSVDEKKYVGTWVDSMSTDVDTSEGVASNDGKTITWTATCRDTETRKIIKQKRVQTTQDDNHHTLTFYGAGPDGKEGPMMTIEYTRRGK